LSRLEFDELVSLQCLQTREDLARQQAGWQAVTKEKEGKSRGKSLSGGRPVDGS